MKIMQIGSSTLYNIGSSYTIKLSEKEILVVEDDPVSKSRYDAKKAENEKKREEQKAQEVEQNSSPQTLSQDEQRLLKDFSSRDSEVKAHEAAHQSAGGGMTGAASYTYQQGPDGKMYAIGGEVSIASPGGATPEETIQNAKQIVAAAMAAGDPSSQDFAVAASARAMEIKAQAQKSKELQEKIDANLAYAKESLSLNADKSDKTQNATQFPSLDISA